MTNYDSVEGLIIRVYENNPTDKVILIINKEGEKYTLLAKNIKSSTGKRLQLAVIGNLVKIKFVKGYSLPLLTDINVINEFISWKKDFKGMMYLQLMLEIINFFTFEDNPEPESYYLIEEILLQDVNRAEYLLGIFTLKLLQLTGNLPELSKDNRTNENITSENARLDLDGIGYVKDNGTKYLDKDDRIYKVQRYLIENDIKTSLKINLGNEESKKMLNIQLNWVETVIDKEIKSRQVLRDMGFL